MTENQNPGRSDKPREGSVVRPADKALPVFAPSKRSNESAKSTGAANVSDLNSPERMATTYHRSAETSATISNDSPWDRISKSQAAIDLDTLYDALNESHNQEEDPPQATIRDKIKRNRHPLSSFFTSLLAHVSLFLCLMFIVFSIPDPLPRISVLAEFDADPIYRDRHDVQSEKVKIELPEEAESPIEMIADDVSDQQELQLADNPNKALNSISENDVPSTNQAEAPVRPNQLTMPSGGGLEGRESNARSRLAATRGGSRASEMAVERGLQWIIEHQNKDGSWRFHHHKGPCDGRCANPGTRESTTAATGLALMSLLGAGYTHRSGPYQDQVGQGLDYLLSRIRYTKHGGILAEGRDGMYAQAIATIALAEAFSLTHDTNLTVAIEAACKYIVTAQHDASGSWGYNPDYPGDLTVTGWQLMALKSCELAGYTTDESVWKKAEKFIDSTGTGSSGRYGYKQPAEDNPTTTAIGLLTKMYLGMPKEDFTLELGSNFIFDQMPSETDVYFNYYATQVMHHLQSPDWKTWNREMRNYLIETQIQGPGHEAGSWYFQDQHGQVGGRLYTTAMAVMILEVYYRFLPLYEDKAIEAQNQGARVLR
jgi:hypothetical protein